ncbi:tetratricopeptide repeat protein [Polymorphospora rubra]|uniref:tetratricopeptide repeat protein n=1 Tax=Polymorphospora rubra TaxID=338584 RepID=UPI003406EEDB
MAVQKADQAQPVPDPPPGPAGARTLDELVRRLRRLHAWSGLSYRELHRRVVRSRRRRGVPELPAYNTVYRSLQPGRSRLDVELVEEIAAVLRDQVGDAAAAGEWRQAYRAITGGDGDAVVVPALETLPADLAEFSGRDDELDRLRDPGPGIVVIEGMAGVGKTALAVHAAHRLLRSGRYGDPQLVVDLRGYDPELPPADPAAVLDTFLRRLGVPGDRIHGLDLAGRTAEFRRILAGRPALVVLDNAASAEQVRPLLPDRPAGLTLVTSRAELTGLRITHRVRLDVFTTDEALAFLRRAAGPDRIDAAPDTAARIAEQLGHLPLALGLLAGRIRVDPEWTLEDHLERLVEQRRTLRLDRGVDVALALSYQGLPAEQQRLLRLVALHPGRDLDQYAAAALADTDVTTATRRLDALVTATVLRRPAAGRYELHDLVRIYAGQRARDGDPASARRAALTRLLGHYRYAAARAMDRYAPHEGHRRPAVPDPGVPVPAFADRSAAGDWLDRTRTNLLTAARYAVEQPTGHDVPEFPSDLSGLLFRYLDLGAHHQDAGIVHLLASRSEDPVRRARALSDLGVTSFRLGRYDDAVDHLRQALSGARATGDERVEGRTLGHLGNILLWLGRYEEALECHEQAVAVSRALGDRPAESANLSGLGNVCWRLGRYEEAIGYYRQDLDIARDLGDRPGEGLTLGNLGATFERIGRFEEAIDHHRQALAIADEAGDRIATGRTLGNLGSTYHALGNHTEALTHYRNALAIARDLDDQHGETEMLNGVGNSLCALGSPAEATAHHERALALAAGLGEPFERARAHDGIARARAALGEPAAARTHWRVALDGYAALGTPEAAEVAARLRELEPGPAGPDR